ncbi:PIN domain-containing protein [Hymenobacter sp.]|uniref:PIN domain-containing protein n=1 Tax=Hymenobacter sp. TaxID=1898978 RepID=UPI00286C1065|nr:PIN domain-containing protein [Hymenobacter sp.]
MALEWLTLFCLPWSPANCCLERTIPVGQPRIWLTIAALIYDLNFLLLDESAAEHYAEIHFSLKQKGRPIPENDMWIAAICRAHNVPLLTFDHHFAEVSSLALVAL